MTSHRPRVLTGIKPTGSPHVGNYLGAIRPALRLAENPSVEAMYFVADYHALTLIHDREELNRLSYEVAATWLALGLNPERVLFYRQSDVPEIFEFSWMLHCFTAKGWMNKAHAYKARVATNRESGTDDDAGVNMGLFSYPVLMAADILLFDVETVPVGQDQVQHVEIARDMADRFNTTYGAGEQILRLPEFQVQKDVATVPGIDGRKMSKSYDNTLPLFAPPKRLKKLVNRILSDSTPVDDPKDPSQSIVFEIYSQFGSSEQVEELRERYAAGISWGHAKLALFELLEESFGEQRERYNELMSDPQKMDQILDAGADKARAIARPRLQRLREAIGISKSG